MFVIRRVQPRFRRRSVMNSCRKKKTQEKYEQGNLLDYSSSLLIAPFRYFTYLLLPAWPILNCARVMRTKLAAIRAPYFAAVKASPPLCSFSTFSSTLKTWKKKLNSRRRVSNLVRIWYIRINVPGSQERNKYVRCIFFMSHGSFCCQVYNLDWGCAYTYWYLVYAS